MHITNAQTLFMTALIDFNLTASPPVALERFRFSSSSGGGFASVRTRGSWVIGIVACEQGGWRIRSNTSSEGHVVEGPLSERLALDRIMDCLADV